MSAPNNMYDVVVVGGGPAGLTAALYLARAKYRVVVLEKENFGGQITITSEVVNYPGVLKTDGKALTETMRQQAESFGAEFMKAEVTSLELDGDVKTINTNRGKLQAFGVLLATGAHPRMVGFKGEAEFKGHGVAYCATCDGEFFTGMEVFVIGGGFAAAEESVFLTKYASHVTILVRGDDFSCAKATADEARNNPNITILTNTEVEEVMGDSSLKSIRYRNNKTGEITTYSPTDNKGFGVFVFAGYAPATDLVKDVVELDKGYIVTDRNQKTNIDGVYAAGDVCVKKLRQVVTAVGDGATAATELERYAAAMQAKTGVKPEQPKVESPKATTETAKPTANTSNSSLFTPDMLAQLNAVFGRMESSLVLKLSLDDRAVSTELKGYMDSLAELTDKLTVEIDNRADAPDAPCVSVYKTDGSFTGLAFHGVPGGHEFTSFILGLYNAAGKGQAVEEDSAKQIASISEKVDIKILVSLSCTMCPETVMSAQKIASMNENVTAEAYDLNHFPELREKYKVMSVPCTIITKGDDEKVTFGKKNIANLLVDVIS